MAKTTNITNGKEEFLYRVVASSSGVRIFKYKIFSITSKNIVYINGGNKKRLRLDELDTYQVSEVSHDVFLNPAYIFTLDILEDNPETKEDLCLECLEIYVTKCLDKVKTYNDIIHNVRKTIGNLGDTIEYPEISVVPS